MRIFMYGERNVWERQAGDPELFIHRQVVIEEITTGMASHWRQKHAIVNLPK